MAFIDHEPSDFRFESETFERLLVRLDRVGLGAIRVSEIRDNLHDAVTFARAFERDGIHRRGFGNAVASVSEYIRMIGDFDHFTPTADSPDRCERVWARIVGTFTAASEIPGSDRGV